jgi:hypothetical protein
VEFHRRWSYQQDRAILPAPIAHLGERCEHLLIGLYAFGRACLALCIAGSSSGKGPASIFISASEISTRAGTVLHHKSIRASVRFNGQDRHPLPRAATENAAERGEGRIVQVRGHDKAEHHGAAVTDDAFF